MLLTFSLTGPAPALAFCCFLWTLSCFLTASNFSPADSKSALRGLSNGTRVASREPRWIYNLLGTSSQFIPMQRRGRHQALLVGRAHTFQIKGVPVALRGLVILLGHAGVICSSRRPDQLVTLLEGHNCTQQSEVQSPSCRRSLLHSCCKSKKCRLQRGRSPYRVFPFTRLYGQYTTTNKYIITYG